MKMSDFDSSKMGDLDPWRWVTLILEDEWPWFMEMSDFDSLKLSDFDSWRWMTDSLKVSDLDTWKWVTFTHEDERPWPIQTDALGRKRPSGKIYMGSYTPSMAVSKQIHSWVFKEVSGWSPQPQVHLLERTRWFPNRYWVCVRNRLTVLYSDYKGV